MTHPATPKFPSREMIERRMQAKLGYNHEFLTTLLPPLAEAVESLFLTEWLDREEKIEPPEKAVEIVRKGKVWKYHYCSNCGFQNVHPIHNYCPSCGVRIHWVEKGIAPVVKLDPLKDHPWRKHLK